MQLSLVQHVWLQMHAVKDKACHHMDWETGFESDGMEVATAKPIEPTKIEVRSSQESPWAHPYPPTLLRHSHTEIYWGTSLLINETEMQNENERCWMWNWLTRGRIMVLPSSLLIPSILATDIYSRRLELALPRCSSALQQSAPK